MYVTSPDAQHAALIDIDREREHWKQAYQTLPRANAVRSFVRYWPMLMAAYDIYLNYPHSKRDESLRMYLVRQNVVSSVLNEREASVVFDHVWNRIGQAHRTETRGAPRTTATS